MSIDTGSAGIGSMGDGDTPDDGDFYAPDDARVPKVLGKTLRRKPCKPKKKKGKCKKESFQTVYEKLLEKHTR